MGTWFSASAVQPALQDRWDIGVGTASWLTSAVQIGFVAGSLLSASLNLADRIQPRYLIACGALCAGFANLGLLVSGSFPLAIGCRALTGAALAAVYPVGMKLVATYFRLNRGLAIGVVIGALTLGSGSPHLVKALPEVSWQAVIVLTSAAALASTGVILRVRQGPFAGAAGGVDPGFMVRALRDRPLRLAIGGYLGHMWELYAFWAWLPAFTAAALSSTGSDLSGSQAELIAFGVIGVSGAAGAVAAGRIGDRVGRTHLTSAAMLISGACCLLSPLIFDWPLLLLLPVLLVWGAAVIADSGQFSAAVTELAPSRYVGTALTLQTALGFIITVGSIALVAHLGDALGWRYALMVLALGPACGIVAMLALRQMPEAKAMAGGRR
jgi:MFS family permease